MKTTLVRGGWIGAVMAALCLAAPVARGQDDVRDAVVKLYATQRLPDPVRPWTKQSPREISGTGVLISEKRILTNAHVVLYASQLFVQPHQSGEKLSAKATAIAPGIDLAIVTVDDEAFHEGRKPLKLAAKLPRPLDSVSVYGYPQGGTELAVTKGVVSRIDYESYNSMTQGLRIQVDAAINPGNSGGPALVGDEMIGVAFSRLGGSDNIGYIIPTEEIDRFLEDVADGHYDGKPAFLDQYQTLENDAIRAFLKLEKSAPGVMITRVGDPGPDYPLKDGDIITKIGDQSIDNTGKVRLDGDRLLSFMYLVPQFAKEGKVPMTIVRDGAEKTVEVPVGPDRDQRLVPPLLGRYPSYFIFGPLVFSEVSDDLVSAMLRPPTAGRALAFVGSPLVTRSAERPSFPGERLVVISHPMFTHRLGKGYSNPFMQVVAEVNGTRIKNLAHLVEVLRDATSEFVEFRFANERNLETIVFRRAEALTATEEVLNDNSIRMPYSEDLAPIWNKQP